MGLASGQRRPAGLAVGQVGCHRGRCIRRGGDAVPALARERVGDVEGPSPSSFHSALFLPLCPAGLLPVAPASVDPGSPGGDDGSPRRMTAAAGVGGPEMKAAHPASLQASTQDVGRHGEAGAQLFHHAKIVPREHPVQGARSPLQRSTPALRPSACCTAPVRLRGSRSDIGRGWAPAGLWRGAGRRAELRRACGERPVAGGLGVSMCTRRRPPHCVHARPTESRAQDLGTSPQDVHGS